MNNEETRTLAEIAYRGFHKGCELELGPDDYEYSSFQDVRRETVKGFESAASAVRDAVLQESKATEQAIRERVIAELWQRVPEKKPTNGSEQDRLVLWTNSTDEAHPYGVQWLSEISQHATDYLVLKDLGRPAIHPPVPAEAPVEASPPQQWTLPAPPEGRQWHRTDWTQEMLPDGYRPALLGEVPVPGDEYKSGFDLNDEFDPQDNVTDGAAESYPGFWRIHRPLPSPQAPEGGQVEEEVTMQMLEDAIDHLSTRCGFPVVLDRIQVLGTIGNRVENQDRMLDDLRTRLTTAEQERDEEHEKGMQARARVESAEAQVAALKDRFIEHHECGGDCKRPICKLRRELDSCRGMRAIENGKLEEAGKEVARANRFAGQMLEERDAARREVEGLKRELASCRFEKDELERNGKGLYEDGCKKSDTIRQLQRELATKPSTTWTPVSTPPKHEDAIGVPGGYECVRATDGQTAWVTVWNHISNRATHWQRLSPLPLPPAIPSDEETERIALLNQLRKANTGEFGEPQDTRIAGIIEDLIKLETKEASRKGVAHE